MKIHLIAAARPNFMKIAPLYHELKKRSGLEPFIIHTGQHYDINMSDIFFKNFALSAPYIHLGVGSGTHAEQTGNVMIAYEKVLLSEKPDLVIVPGDVNSTVAATLASVKQGVKTAHLEAGLRSFDRTMPEEINRVITDSIADILWTPSVDGDQNLINEGVSKERIEFVGNIMIDAFEMNRARIEERSIYRDFDLQKNKFGVITLHRPFNVDNPERLERLCLDFIFASKKIPFVFPIHPRTILRLKETELFEILSREPSIKLTEPLGYIDFMSLVVNSRLIITDSGGVQEESTYLGIPCLTLRPNTERPVTIAQGTNRLCSVDDIRGMVDLVLSNGYTKGTIPELWDGKTAERVADSIQRHGKDWGLL